MFYYFFYILMEDIALHTNKWVIRLRLFVNETPYTVANFITLARQWFYNNLAFHRVIENFMIQGWCPMGTGTWWPWYQFADEFHWDLRHNQAGILSMANSWPHTNGSQFFITHTSTPRLDDKHTIFGTVLDQIDQVVVDSIRQWDTITSVVISEELQLPPEVEEFVATIIDTLAKKSN